MKTCNWHTLLLTEGGQLSVCSNLWHYVGFFTDRELYKVILAELWQTAPFRVNLPLFGFHLIYREAKLKLSIPVEFGLDHSCDIGTALIKHWDGSTAMFDRHQIATIERNIFDALDHLGIRCTNAR